MMYSVSKLPTTIPEEGERRESEVEEISRELQLLLIFYFKWELTL